MTTCNFCGKECKNVKMHERYCKSNPSLSKQEKQEEKKPIIITDVQQYISDDYTDGLVAWFDDGAGNKIIKNPVLSGIMHSGNELLPVMLLPTVEGLFLPPFMLPGFIGMYTRKHEFEPQSEEESKPITEIIEPIKSPVTQEVKEDRVITPLQTTSEEQKEGQKVGFFQALGFGKKKDDSQPKPSTRDLLKELDNVTT